MFILRAINLTNNKLKLTFKYMLAFAPWGIYILGVQLFGEVHPFSRFPMYSSFPPTANYYYLADENNNPLSAYYLTGMTIDELRDMMFALQESKHIEWNDRHAKQVLASECLEKIKQKIPAKNDLKEIKWMWHEIYGSIDNIQERKTVLATCKLN